MDGGVRGQYEKFAKMPLISALAPESECALSMSDPAFPLPCLRDERLRPVATSALPAWLWSADANRILWANPSGAAIFGAATSAAISAQIRRRPAGRARCATRRDLAADGSTRVERLRGFAPARARAHVRLLAHHARRRHHAVLVVAAERGPELALNERVRRLLADAAPVAVSRRTALIHATRCGGRLDGATSLATLGAAALAADACGPVMRGSAAQDRSRRSIGSDAARY